MPFDLCPLAKAGQKVKIRWAIRAGGACPCRDFYKTLTDKERAKVMALFSRLADHGKITNKEQFKKVEGEDLFEFKSFQIRFLGSWYGKGRFVLAHGLKKKQDRLRSTDIEKAKRIIAGLAGLKKGN